MASEKNRGPISEALRDYIRHSPLRQGEIADQAKMTDSNLSKFLSGKQGITLSTAEGLCKVLGLILVPQNVPGLLPLLGSHDPVTFRRLTEETRLAMKAGFLSDLRDKARAGKTVEESGQPDSLSSEDNSGHGVLDRSSPSD